MRNNSTVHTQINSDNAFISARILEWTRNYIHSPLADNNRQEALELVLEYFPHDEISTLYEYTEELSAKEDDEDARFDKRFCRSIRKETTRYEKISALFAQLESDWYEPWTEDIKNYLFTTIESLIDHAHRLEHKDPYLKRFNYIRDIFSLTDFESTALVYFFIREVNEEFENITGTSNRYLSRTCRILNTFSTFTGENRTDTYRLLAHNCPLKKYEIVENHMEISPHIVEYLSGITHEPILSRLYKKYTGTALPPDAHSIYEQHGTILTSIITNKKKKEGINILFYGKPGSGKTEFARTLATHLDMTLYEIVSNNKNESKENSFSRYTAFYTCENTTPRDESIILVDEADEMLNGKSSGGLLSFFGGAAQRNSDKNKINELLDTTNSTVIWITNHYNSIEESTRRRFDYSLHFSDFTYEQRSNIWNTVVNTYALGEEITNERIHELARTYPLNAGGIDIVLRNFARLPADMRSHDMLIKLITQHIRLMGKKNMHMTHTPVTHYSLDGINVKGAHSLKETIHILKNFSEDKNTVHPAINAVQNMNMLLYGPPGTGKTEFIKYLAQELDKELLIVRGSDLLNCYVGQTEKNIATIFHRAENQNAVLFIDEIDGLLFSRDKAARGFEASQVNEMLTQMESFTGILACATNHHKNMDTATFRRFTLKYEFDYLTPRGVRVFYDIYLAPLIGKNDAKRDSRIAANLSRKEEKYLTSLSYLTPGDFKTVAQKHAYLKDETVTHHKLIGELADECSYKSGVTTHAIGF